MDCGERSNSNVLGGANEYQKAWPMPSQNLVRGTRMSFPAYVDIHQGFYCAALN